MRNFDFGENWDSFSSKALDEYKIKQAKKDFRELFRGINLKRKNFLDIGFGQGLSLLIAKERTAHVVGLEVNQKCKTVLEKNINNFFPNLKNGKIPIVLGSILNKNDIQKLKKIQNGKLYDIVHSWGVLHHTGNMRKAIHNSATLVKVQGYLVISIYNKHWTSIIWLLVKKTYSFSPNILKKMMIFSLYPIIWTAKFLVTRRNPFHSRRGMDFFYNVVDWVGGYPYEYASIEEIKQISKEEGFDCIKVISSEVPTGCNEYILKKMG